MNEQGEREFQIALAKAFEANGCRVALCDVSVESWSLRFSSSGLKPDLLVSMRSKIPELKRVIGVETKLDGDHSISRTFDGVQKVIALSLEKPVYKVWKRGEEKLVKVVSEVSEYYLATPMSVKEGIVCEWEDTWAGMKWPPVAHRYFTVTTRLFLKRYGGGILLKGVCPTPPGIVWPCPEAQGPV